MQYRSKPKNFATDDRKERSKFYAKRSNGKYSGRTVTWHTLNLEVMGPIVALVHVPRLPLRDQAHVWTSGASVGAFAA